MCFLRYSSIHKGYKCLHVPSNRVYISRDVVFDEHVFPFSDLTTPSTISTPSVHTSPMLPDQFLDATHSPSLLSSHGVGIGRCSRLQLLYEAKPTAASPPSADVDHVDRPVCMPHAARPLLASALPASAAARLPPASRASSLA
jgi:hypothetical protein